MMPWLGPNPSPNKGTKGPSTSNNDEVQPPSTIKTPSPSQVTSDLIDATCHEILSLQGDEKSDSIPSVSSFAVLAQRLDYYLDQCLSTTSDEPLLEDNIKTRLLLAKLVLVMCVRSAYPSDDLVDSDDDDADAASQELPPLIEMTEEEWKSLRLELGTLTKNLSSVECTDSDLLEGFICQIEAFEALAELRSQLQLAISEIEEDESKSPSKKKPPTTFSFISGHVEEYRAKAEKINGKLESIDKNLFVPNEMLSMKRCSTIQRVKASAESLVAGIEDMVAKKVFPLNYLQTSLWELLQKLETNYLPAPTLYQVGYFNDGSSKPAASPASRTKSSEATTPVSPSAASSNGHASSLTEIILTERRKAAKKTNYDDDISSDSEEEEAPKKRKIIAGKKKEASQFDFESDEEEVELQLESVKKKKQKRIPYSEEEKGALLQGVEEFGKGEWRKIRDQYADIFDANKRSTVNLKDLYRTLTK